MVPLTLYLSTNTTASIYLAVPPGGSAQFAPTDDLNFKVLSEAGPYGLPVLVHAIHPGHHVVAIDLKDSTGISVEQVEMEVHAFRICIDVDADRDRVVGVDEPLKSSWIWGRRGVGAICLVNCDPAKTPPDATDDCMRYLAPIEVRALNYGAPLPAGISLVLSATPNTANRMRIFRRRDNRLEQVLGRDILQSNQVITNSDPLDPNGETFYMEALQFPDQGFEGLITIELHLLIQRQHQRLTVQERWEGVPGSPGRQQLVKYAAPVNVDENEVIGADRVVFRVAPWIQLPDTQKHTTIFAAVNQDDINADFLKDLKRKLKRVGAELTVLTFDQSGDNAWVEDSIKFGYSALPKAPRDMVCFGPGQGPTNEDVLGSDLQGFHLQGPAQSSLDAFGNVQCSPPVKVRVPGRRSPELYPFGRIVFGGRLYGDYPQARQVMASLRSFLFSQKLQKPIEVFSDWLEVGHTDEVLSFVSVPRNRARQGFIVLLPSPARAFALLEYAVSQDPEVTLFKGKSRCDDGSSAEVKVSDLLNNGDFREVNQRCQRYCNLNREILIGELDLAPEDICDIPQLFTGQDHCQSPVADFTDGRAGSFMPNMVNHLVLERTSVMPRPYGPRIGKNCLFEQDVIGSMKRYNRRVEFVDDWSSCYVNFGDVHCATNARRERFQQDWWTYKPDGAFDVIDALELSGGT